MIDVRVREDHGVESGGIDGNVAVPLERLVAVPLVQSTIQQHRRA
jgi:hypothetical protein